MVGGKHICVDLIGVFPPVRLVLKILLWNGQPLKLLQVKQSNMRKCVSDNQHAFIPFLFDIFDFLTLKSVNFLKKVQRVYV
jgi:hypothetical protein